MASHKKFKQQAYQVYSVRKIWGTFLKKMFRMLSASYNGKQSAVNVRNAVSKLLL
jgi:hypothetical protein